MKLLIISLTCVCISFFILGCTSPKENTEKQTKLNESNDKPKKTGETAKKPKKLLRHAVTIKFKDSVSKEEVLEISKDFEALKNKIPSIKEFEWGLIDSPEDLHEDFTFFFNNV